jgi:hypothetical protein
MRVARPKIDPGNAMNTAILFVGDFSYSTRVSRMAENLSGTQSRIFGMSAAR